MAGGKESRKSRKRGAFCSLSGEHRRCDMCGLKTCPSSDCARQLLLQAEVHGTQEATGRYGGKWSVVFYLCAGTCETKYRLGHPMKQVPRHR